MGSLCLFVSVTLDKLFSLSESACNMQGQTVYGTLTSGIFRFVLSPIEKYKKMDSPVQVTQRCVAPACGGQASSWVRISSHFPIHSSAWVCNCGKQPLPLPLLQK